MGAVSLVLASIGYILNVAFPTFYITRSNFSLDARYSLKFTRCSLLVVKSLVASCRFALYSLQKLLVIKNHSLLVANFTRGYQRDYQTNSK